MFPSFSPVTIQDYLFFKKPKQFHYVASKEVVEMPKKWQQANYVQLMGNHEA